MFSQKRNSTEIYQSMRNVYAECASSVEIVKLWAQVFGTGLDSLYDDPHRPFEAAADENVSKVGYLVGKTSSNQREAVVCTDAGLRGTRQFPR